LTTQPLAGTEGALAPFWSPDNHFIGFFAGGPNGTLKKIAASGGPPLTLCDFPGMPVGASWSGDDVILFTTGVGGGFTTAAGAAGARPGSIRRVSASGGASSIVLAPDSQKGETEYWWPFFLPDRRHFVYLALGVGARPIGIYAASLDSNDRKLLVHGGSNAKYAQGYLTFLREQTLMAQAFDVDRLQLIGDTVPIAEEVDIGGGSGATGAFTISETGVLAYYTGSEGNRSSQLTWFDRAGTPLGIVGDEASYADLHLSRDGTRASVSLPDPTLRTRDIWLVDLARGLRTRFTFDKAEEQTSLWSPDGSRLIFNSRRKGAFDLYQKASNGAGTEELLLGDDADKLPVSWSADGRFILFMRHGGGETGWDLWALPLFGDRKPFPIVQTRFDEGPGEFSPDGRWIAYVSNESGRLEVYVAPFPGPGGKWQVSTAGVAGPRGQLKWRSDGKEIFYVGPGGLMAASVQAAVGIEIGEVRSLFRLPLTPPGASYDVSADGQRFLVNSAGDQAATAPITLVVNWTAALKK
jgi:hypothetical protein